jgi:hypothetical protein
MDPLGPPPFPSNPVLNRVANAVIESSTPVKPELGILRTVLSGLSSELQLFALEP